jgi:Skp family chaperone for outer membrane proteins
MRKLAALLILLLLSGVMYKLNAQSGFFNISQIVMSYSDIKSWRSL